MNVCSNYEYTHANRMTELLRSAFGPDVPSSNELQRRTSVAFVSTIPKFDYTRPLPENVIAVGGLHIRDPKPLPTVSGSNLNKFFTVEIVLNLCISKHATGLRSVHQFE